MGLEGRNLGRVRALLLKDSTFYLGFCGFVRSVQTRRKLGDARVSLRDPFPHLFADGSLCRSHTRAQHGLLAFRALIKRLLKLMLVHLAQDVLEFGLVLFKDLTAMRARYLNHVCPPIKRFSNRAIQAKCKAHHSRPRGHRA